MAKLITGIDLTANTLTFTISAGTAIANTRTIAVAVMPYSGVKFYLKEKPKAGYGGRVTFENANGVLFNLTAAFDFPTSGGTFTISDIEGVIESVDEGAVLYDEVSREANAHFYNMGEDGARREAVCDLGRALSNQTTTLRLPSNGDYLIITLSPNLEGYSSMWTVRSELGRTHNGMKLGGDGNYISSVQAQAYALGLAVTNNGPSIVRVFAIRLK